DCNCTSAKITPLQQRPHSKHSRFDSSCVIGKFILKLASRFVMLRSMNAEDQRSLSPRAQRCRLCARFSLQTLVLAVLSPCDNCPALLSSRRSMAAIGRFQKGDEIFYAKVVDGQLYRLRGDVFGSPSFDRKPLPLRGVRTLTPVVPSKIIA